ncbi:bifunctional riboflavin kinase/FAD synthetase [Alkalithermobacter paradoxus]|uniref:Riboflavin biosynthesis protein n=1 Tax=Alkalithermobacter paradoxus TaxID=29349 RepID=A0A1V4IAW4_9FIRM|nr:riboflavin biosynthesis protein RibF [[Clostridium] thermoalcaliphilum]
MHIIKTLDDLCIKEPTIITIGNFDGVHLGHQRIIQKVVDKAKKENLKSIVFTFLNHPMNFFRAGTVKSLTTLDEKYLFIKNIGIDCCLSIPFDSYITNLSPAEYVEKILVNKLKAKEIVIGHDFTFGKNKSGNSCMLKEIATLYDINVEIVEPIKINRTRISSSIIRKMIENGDVDKSKEFLGRYYSLQGKVIHGMKLGRRLGFPTANIQINEDVVIPKKGVYYTKIYFKNKVYYGATNIGLNPTIGNRSLSIETYILDFDRDIYEEEIIIHFIERIRDEKKFHSLNELTSQMKKDIEYIRNKKTIYI